MKYVKVRVSITVGNWPSPEGDDDQGATHYETMAQNVIELTIPAVESKFIDLSKPVAGVLAETVEDHLRKQAKADYEAEKGTQGQFDFNGDSESVYYEDAEGGNGGVNVGDGDGDD